MYFLMILLTITVLIIFIVGLAEPSNIIIWGYNEDKTRKKVFKYFGTSLLICLIFLGVTRDIASDSARKEAQTQKVAAQQKKEADAKKKEDEENKKYVILLDSGKNYEAMTNQERTDITELLQNWNKKSQEFQNKYQSKKEFIEKSKNDATVKWKAEKEAQDAQKVEEEKIGYDTGITYNQLARTPDDYKGKKAKFAGKVIQVMEGDKETDLRIAVGGNYDTVLFVGYDPKITSTRILENDNVTVKGKSVGIYSYQSTMGGKISIPGMWGDNIVINNK